MLSASACVSPNETVTRLSTSCTVNAPPVAEFATKSAVSATGRRLQSGLLEARLGRVLGVDRRPGRAAPGQAGRRRRALRGDPSRLGQSTEQPGQPHRSRGWLSFVRRVRRRGPSPQVRAARRQRRREPAARAGAGCQRVRRARAVRARDRASRVRGGRVVRRRRVRRPARAPRAHCERRRGPARLLAAVGGRALRRARPHRRCAARHLRQPGARALLRSRRRARRQGADEGSRRSVAPAERRRVQLVDRRLSRTKAGREPSSTSRTSSVSGTRSRTPCASTPTTRSPRGASTSRACRRAPPRSTSAGSTTCATAAPAPT